MLTNVQQAIPLLIAMMSYGANADAQTPWVGDGASVVAAARYSPAYGVLTVPAATPATEPPTVMANTPAAGAHGLSIGTSISVSFSEPMAPLTMTDAALELRDAMGLLVPSSVRYDEASNTVTALPVQLLGLAATYTVSVRGGTDTNAATDIAGNRLALPFSWSFTTQVMVLPPTITVIRELHVRSASIVMIPSEDRDPQDLPLTYTWTQLSGPLVTLHSATSANPSIVTPDIDTTLRIRGTAFNGFATASAEVEVFVRQQATASGMSPSTGGTSDLRVFGTTLRHGFLLERRTPTMTITLRSDDGSTLQPSADGPLTVVLDNGTNNQDVTALFTYSPVTNALSVDGEATASLRRLLRGGWNTLSITADDSVGNHADLVIPLLRGMARVQGTTIVTRGTGTTVGGTVALVEAERGFRATTVVAADGSFTIDDVPDGNYELTLAATDGIAGGTSVTVSDDLAADTVTANIDAAPMSAKELPNVPCDPGSNTCIVEWTSVIPRGTSGISVNLRADWYTGYPGATSSESCEYALNQRVDHNRGTKSVRVYLDGDLLASTLVSMCGLGPNGQVLSTVVTSVRARTRHRDAVLRVVETSIVDRLFEGHYGSFWSPFEGSITTVLASWRR